MKSVRQILKSSAVFSAGQLFENLGNMVLGFFVARWLGPTIQGIWQTARLFRTYSDLASMGQALGMRREVAVALGAGNQAEVEVQRDTSFTWNSLSLLAAGIAVAVYAATAGVSPFLRLALMAIAVSIALAGPTSFFNLWYKTVGRFGVLAMTAVAGGLSSLAVVYLVHRSGFRGLILGYVLTGAVMLGCLVAAYRGPLHLRFSAAAWRRSFRVGFPLFVLSAGAILFGSIDRIVVVGMLGFSNMGFYSISTMSFLPVQMVVSSVAVVLLPYACRRFGQDGSAADMTRYFLEPLRLLMVGLAGVAGLAAVTLPVIVQFLLPGYESGIRPAQIVMIGLPFGCAAAFLENVLVASARTWWIVAATALSSVAKLALAWLGVRLGLVGVAWATTLASALYFGILFAVAFWLTRCPVRAAAARLAELVLASASAVATWWFVKDLRVFWPVQLDHPEMLLRAGALAALLAASAGVTWVRLRGVMKQK